MSRVVTVGLPGAYAGLAGIGYMGKQAMNDKAGRDLFAKIKDSKEPVTGMMTTVF